ncbi:MAG: DNA cytosine methyltransferase [Candidatus Omnitrophica bacterium]|nr:DNA cytosine methyltransferase [Candidatus Omnitrophota bacterium]
MLNKYLVVDLFAGPGGLGEGFSAFRTKKSEYPFKIGLSIEKDVFAHNTLELRSFFRQFAANRAPQEYYRYIKGEITKEELFKKYPLQAKASSEEAWHAELGETPHGEVSSRIKNALNKEKKWVLIGGPPCQAYSVMGRVRIKAENPDNFEEDHRHFLYKEYLKIIRDHEPPVFVMENVKGILSSKIKGECIFDKILDDLSCPSKAFTDTEEQTGSNGNLKYNIYSLVKNKNGNNPYDNRDYVIKCENYGIPQRRHRVILLGIRSDLKVKPNLLYKSSDKINMWDVLKGMPKLRSGVTDMAKDSPENWKKAISKIRNYAWFKEKRVEVDLIKQMDRCLAKIKNSFNLGGEYISHNKAPSRYKTWFFDSKLDGVCNHTARKHIKKDLRRYFYAACFAREYLKSPEINDFPRVIWPDHENVLQASHGSMFTDRFRVQLKNKPSTTITCHISKDGHYFIHPDPIQCRSLTVREVARLQTFPDNYFFEGPRTSQYSQVGNAVPPLLAKKIAKIVYGIFKQFG